MALLANECVNKKEEISIICTPDSNPKGWLGSCKGTC